MLDLPQHIRIQVLNNQINFDKSCFIVLFGTAFAGGQAQSDTMSYLDTVKAQGAVLI